MGPISNQDYRVDQLLCGVHDREVGLVIYLDGKVSRG